MRFVILRTFIPSGILPEERRKVLNGADEAADFRPSGGGWDHTDTSTGIHRRRWELEEKRGEIMNRTKEIISSINELSGQFAPYDIFL